MKKGITLIIVWHLLVEAVSQNPVLPIGNYIADPSAKVFKDGKLYIYGSKDESTRYWCSHKYDVVSTSDLKQWDIHSNVFLSKGKNDSVGYNDALLFAPDCEFLNGKYYLYYCQPYKNAPEGVAVSDSPFGPFEDARPIYLKGNNQIDPSVFIDDDGQAYYLWGQFTLKLARLNSDGKTLDTLSIRDSVLTEKEHFFHEGAYLVKRGDLYYLVYADISRAGMPTCIGYATSKNIYGPYKYGGVIIDNDHCDPAVWNNHGSIIEFKNQWYVFYHRSSHASEMMRRMCVEPIFFNNDGSIPEVEMTSQGAGPPLNAFETIEAERACLLYGGVHISKWKNTNEALTGIQNKDRVAYKYIDFGEKPPSQVELTIRGNKEPGKILIALDKSWHKNIATINIPACNNKNDWVTITANVKPALGVNELWFTFLGNNNSLFSVDKFRFK